MTDLLSDVTRWVGVIIAVVGTVVIAPDGTRHLLSTSAAWTRHRAHQLRGRLARVLPFLRRDVTIHAATVTATATAGSAVAVTGSVRVWRPSAPVDERIELLREHIIEVEAALSQVTAAVTKESREREVALSQLRGELQQSLGEVRRRLDEQEHDDARIDARGLPVVGLGIVYSGVPDELAGLPVGSGWIFPVLGVVAAIIAVRGAWQGRQSGSSAVAPPDGRV